MKRVSMKQLCSACGTRDKGREVAEKIREQVNAPPIEVDLSDSQMISVSFLDEVVCELEPHVSSGDIVFRVADTDIERKLQRVAGIRDKNISCRSGNRAIHKVLPIRPSLLKANIVTTKHISND